MGRKKKPNSFPVSVRITDVTEEGLEILNILVKKPAHHVKSFFFNNLIHDAVVEEFHKLSGIKNTNATLNEDEETFLEKAEIYLTKCRNESVE